MTDTYKLLKNELRVYYPDITDVELTNITTNLINFYSLLVEIETNNTDDCDNQVNQPPDVHSKRLSV